jgi:hypothetical protein
MVDVMAVGTNRYKKIVSVRVVWKKKMGHEPSTSDSIDLTSSSYISNERARETENNTKNEERRLAFWCSRPWW